MAKIETTEEELLAAVKHELSEWAAGLECEGLVHIEADFIARCIVNSLGQPKYKMTVYDPAVPLIDLPSWLDGGYQELFG